MLVRIPLIVAAIGLSFPFAHAEHAKSQHQGMSPSSVEAFSGCCLSVEGQTAQVLIAPNANAIRRIQAELAVRGFNPGHIDGILGPRTLRALQAFQRDEGLIEGLLTVETLSRLGISVHRPQHHAQHPLVGGDHVGTVHRRSASACCHTAPTRTVRRVVRRMESPARMVKHQPEPTERAERLPNYVSATSRHDVEALTWANKTPR
ncbi:MAG: peptidoglycan-binding domain-containing protein [Pseudomonadota bacterium]